jgi:hypothetical protein
MKQLLLAMVLMVGGWMSPVDVTQAGQLPSYYPDHFSGYGVVDDIGGAGGTIVIGDVGFQVVDHVIVHGLTSRTIPFSKIRKGDMVGYFVSSSSNGEVQAISEIWLLPDDYAVSEE